MPETNENQDQNITEFVQFLVKEKGGEGMTPEQIRQEEEKVNALVLEAVEDAVMATLPEGAAAELNGLLDNENSDDTEIDAFFAARGINYQEAANAALTKFRDDYLAGRVA